ncbi:MAG: alpha-galactosidase, partial [Clostridia bacterium]|nr:alpha-galactosidase [Clostridia bacterium]
AHPDCDSHLSFKAEITSHNPMYILAPKETFSSPEMHIGLVDGGLDNAVNRMHAHIRKSVLNMPEADGRDALVGAGMGAEHDMGVESTKVFIDRFAELGAEVFIVDAGWVCPPDEQTRWGDYNGRNLPDADRYPNGIGEIVDYCHAKGLKFGLWVDIENLGDFCDAKKEHPEWLAENVFGEKARRFLDFTVPEAAKWAEDELARIISDYRIDLLRVDYNVDCSEYFNMRDTGAGYPECLNIRHFNAVYNMYSNLKKRFPEVIFENCAGGGGRTDLGMMKCFNHTWVSDCQCAPESLYITNGMTMALPPERVDRLFAGMGCHVYGSLDLQMRNTMLTHMTLNVIAPFDAEMNEGQAEFVKHSVKVYKEFIRPFLAESLVYHHTPETEKAKKDGVMILEIASPDKSKGAATVMTLVNSGEKAVVFKPKGADKSKQYKVTLDNEGESFVVAGRELCSTGIEINLPASLCSELILYSEI